MRWAVAVEMIPGIGPAKVKNERARVMPVYISFRVIMSRPKRLLLDEPSLGLAPIIVKQIFDIIRKINQEDKVTIFLVAQNATLALKIADRGYVMETGVITMTDTGKHLLSNEDVKKAYLGM